MRRYYLLWAAMVFVLFGGGSFALAGNNLIAGGALQRGPERGVVPAEGSSTQAPCGRHE